MVNDIKSNNFHCQTPLFSRNCIPDDIYNSYDCIENYVDQRIEKEVSCILPAQAYNNPNINKNICLNKTMFLSNILFNKRFCNLSLYSLFIPQRHRVEAP